MSDINLKKTLDIGDIVKLRNGDWYIYTGKNFRRENIYIDIFYYNDVLDYIYMKKPDFDVIEVKSLTKEALDTLGEEKIKVSRKWIKTPSLLNKMFGELTYAEAHKKMFMDIADGKYTSKREWIVEHGSFMPFNQCFACDEARSRAEEDDLNTDVIKSYCDYCPLGGGGVAGNNCLNGLYKQYSESEGFKKFEAAYKIANLDWEESIIEE